MTDTLEEEFKDRKFFHKYCVVQTALIVYADEGIYQSPLFKGKYDHITGSNEEKARTITHKFADQYFDYDDTTELDSYYDYCWNRLEGTRYITDITNISGDPPSNNDTEAESINEDN